MFRDRYRKDVDRLLDEALNDTDHRHALAACTALAAEVRWITERAVVKARLGGYDWGQIGRLLGITRQGARQRFPDAPPRLPPSTVRRLREQRERREGERVLQQFLDRRGGRKPPIDSRLTWAEFEQLDDDEVIGW